MVDCNSVNVDGIPEEVRVRIVKYVTEKKGMSAKELGYTPQLINMIKHGKARVSNELLCRCLSYLSNEEYVKVIGKVFEEDKASIKDLIKVDSRFRELLIDLH